mmetsp:Transcript_99340/g.179332  ORF Transcript_99340/g.179332 Transcript_99340/m.179332 type:complete len:204 (+) Transcript_99340:32-643(+)
MAIHLLPATPQGGHYSYPSSTGVADVSMTTSAARPAESAGEVPRRARFATRFSTRRSRQLLISAPTASAVSLAKRTICSNGPAGRGPALWSRHKTPLDGHRPRWSTALPSGSSFSSCPSQSRSIVPETGPGPLAPAATKCTLAPATKSRISTLASASARDAAARPAVSTAPSSSKTRRVTSKAVLAYRSRSTTDSSAVCSMPV